MLRTRIIPLLLLKNAGLYKGVQFKNHRYVGDPINAVKIFNDKEVDELIFLDITASLERRGPNFELLADIVSEAFMPFAYGGGIRSLEDAKRLFDLGIEKVVLNTWALQQPHLIADISQNFGGQSVVVAIDAKKRFLGGYEVLSHAGTQSTGRAVLSWAKDVVALGAGEILLNSVDKEGTLSGYDLHLARMLSSQVSIPVILAGGAGCLDDFKKAVDVGVSAVAAGAMFVFYGPHKAVLIQYPAQHSINKVLGEGVRC